VGEMGDGWLRGRREKEKGLEGMKYVRGYVYRNKKNKKKTILFFAEGVW